MPTNEPRSERVSGTKCSSGAFTPRYVAIIPALNEEACISHVVRALSELTRPGGTRTFSAIVVGDNGSTDRTREVASAAGARIARAMSRGYGHGCLAATRITPQADVYVFVDGDDTVDYSQIESLLVSIENGADLSIGCRVNREARSMSAAQIFGNALCCWLIRVFWGASVYDLGPLRAIRAPVFRALNMSALTYGWTLEMQIKAHEQARVTVEIPVSTLPRPIGESKVSPNLLSALRCGRVMLTTIFKLWISRRTRTARSSLPNLTPTYPPFHNPTKEIQP